VKTLASFPKTPTYAPALPKAARNRVSDSAKRQREASNLADRPAPREAGMALPTG
jgi:hypothetical protein